MERDATAPAGPRPPPRSVHRTAPLGFLDRPASRIALLLLACLPPAADADSPSVHAVIRRRAGPSEIVITTTPRVAGAVHSLTWNGKEFIDSFDHGRQMQSASSFDGGRESQPQERGRHRDRAVAGSGARVRYHR